MLPLPGKKIVSTRVCRELFVKLMNGHASPGTPRSRRKKLSGDMSLNSLLKLLGVFVVIFVIAFSAFAVHMLRGPQSYRESGSFPDTTGATQEKSRQGTSRRTGSAPDKSNVSGGTAKVSQPRTLLQKALHSRTFLIVSIVAAVAVVIAAVVLSFVLQKPLIVSGQPPPQDSNQQQQQQQPSPDQPPVQNLGAAVMAGIAICVGFALLVAFLYYAKKKQLFFLKEDGYDPYDHKTSEDEDYNWPKRPSDDAILNNDDKFDQACKQLEFEDEELPDLTKAKVVARYRRLALKYHPDKMANSGMTKQELEEQFKQVANARQILLQHFEKKDGGDGPKEEHTLLDDFRCKFAGGGSLTYFVGENSMVVAILEALVSNKQSPEAVQKLFSGDKYEEQQKSRIVELSQRFVELLGGYQLNQVPSANELARSALQWASRIYNEIHGPEILKLLSEIYLDISYRFLNRSTVVDSVFAGWEQSSRSQGIKRSVLEAAREATDRFKRQYRHRPAREKGKKPVDDEERFDNLFWSIGRMDISNTVTGVCMHLLQDGTKSVEERTRLAGAMQIIGETFASYNPI